jgi:hypothetical protein
MNLTNLGGYDTHEGYDKHIVFDAIWASLRDSLWSSITAPVFDSAWHQIRVYVGYNVHTFHTEEEDDDEGDWL